MERVDGAVQWAHRPDQLSAAHFQWTFCTHRQIRVWYRILIQWSHNIRRDLHTLSIYEQTYFPKSHNHEMLYMHPRTRIMRRYRREIPGRWNRWHMDSCKVVNEWLAISVLTKWHLFVSSCRIGGLYYNRHWQTTENVTNVYIGQKLYFYSAQWPFEKTNKYHLHLDIIHLVWTFL